MAQFVDMDDTAKLTRASFESGTGGIELGAAGAQHTTSHLARRVLRYEVILIDGEHRRHQRKSQLSVALFAHELNGSAVTLSALSAAQRSRLDPFGDDKVKVPGEAYTIAHADTNRPLAAAAASFASEAEARDRLAAIVAADPAAAKTLHVIPAWEAAA
jgi:hypothetical protein